MNFQLVILLSVVACALALPVPDEEVSVLQNAAEIAAEGSTEANELTTTVEQGANTIVDNVTTTAESLPKQPDIESKLTKIVDEVKEAIEDEVPEAPKSLPVKAREETEPVVPVAGVRAEPKEGVEIGEAKATASSPETENTSKIETSDAKQTTESTTPASGSEQKTEAPATEPKPTESAENKAATKPAIAGENKTDNSIPKSTEIPKTSPSDAKVTQAPKEKHEHSSEANKSEDSAESKESDESNESNKSK